MHRRCVAIATGFLVEVAHADDAVAPDADEMERAAEVVRVTERWLDADLFTVAHTSRASTRRTVEPRGGTYVLGDVLDGFPGVSVQRTGPGQGSPIVRGLIGSAVLVVVDGMRLNNAIYRPAPNQYNALVDPWALDRVEVTRGPGSMLFGSDAMSGVVNLITPLPRFDGPAWQHRETVIAGGATADRSLLTRATSAVGRRGSGASVGVTLQRHGDVRAGGGERVEPAAYDSLAVDATGHVERGRNATTVWFQHLDQPSLPRSDELIPGFGQTEPSSQVFLYEPSRRTFAHVRQLLRHPIAALDGLDGVELHAAWQRIQDDRRLRDFGSDEVTAEANRNDSIGAAVRGRGRAFGGTVIAGADYWFDRVTSRRRAQDLAAGTTEVVNGRFADGAMMHQLGVFAEASRSFGPRTLVRAGLRGGLARTDIPAADRGIGAVSDARNWAGELGVEVTVAPEVTVVANAGRAFRNPNVHDLSGLGPRPGNRFQIPAGDLTDERSFGADAGVRVRRSTVEAEAYVFGLAYRDRIDVVPTGEMTDDGRDIVASANIGETNLYGAEGALRVRATARLIVLANATYVHGTQRIGDVREPAERIPPPGGRLAARYLAHERITFDVAVRGARSQLRLAAADREDPRIDPMGTPAFVTLHAGVAVRAGDFDIAARIDNVLDHNYREHASGTDAPGIDVGLLVRWTPRRPRR